MKLIIFQQGHFIEGNSQTLQVILHGEFPNFMEWIEKYSILQNHLPEPVPKRFSPHCEL